MQFFASRNGAVQIFYLIPTRDRFAGKFVKWVRLLAVLWEHIFQNVEWVGILKISGVFFEQNCIVK